MLDEKESSYSDANNKLILNSYSTAGRRQKKKSRRPADTFPCAYEAAALRKIRAAVSFRLS